MHKLLLATAIATIGFATGAQAAGLEGEQVGIKLSIAGFPAFLCANCETTFTVGAGAEGAIYNNTQVVDFGASTFSITSTGNFSQFGFNPAPADRPVTLRLSSLDFSAPLTEVVFTTSLNGPVTRTFGANFAEFTFFDQAVSANQTYLSAQFLTAAVPEPESYAMMLAGLGLVGAAIARRRRTHTVTAAS